MHHFLVQIVNGSSFLLQNQDWHSRILISLPKPINKVGNSQHQRCVHPYQGIQRYPSLMAPPSLIYLKPIIPDSHPAQILFSYPSSHESFLVEFLFTFSLLYLYAPTRNLRTFAKTFLFFTSHSWAITKYSWPLYSMDLNCRSLLYEDFWTIQHC